MDQEKQHAIKKLIFWDVPEYDTHEKSRWWYIMGIFIAVLMMIYSFATANFLFAVIIIITALIIIFRDGQEPEKVRVSITSEGVEVGRKFYDFDIIKDFSVIYKPKFGVNNLYIEFKNPLRHRLSIPLDEINPIVVRETLLKYLEEDLDRDDQPASESLAKLFKL